MTGTPEYLYDLFQKEDSRQYHTRLADKKQIRLKDDRVPKTEMALKSFKWRALQYYNQLPLELRIIENGETFKTLAKKWIRENVSLT